MISGAHPSCIYAANNLVSGNLVTGNYQDLVHHESALGPTWTDNICQTKDGSEIPPCTLK